MINICIFQQIRELREKKLVNFPIPDLFRVGSGLRILIWLYILLIEIVDIKKDFFSYKLDLAKIPKSAKTKKPDPTDLFLL